VLGFDAEGLGAYHLGDVGPDVNSSSVLMALIGLPLDSSQQPVCLVPRLSGGNVAFEMLAFGVSALPRKDNPISTKE
jgi:hypothetical protein